MSDAHGPGVIGTSWARVEPSRGDYDEVELARVRDALRAERAAGRAPMLVLHDGALPDWVIARHGWLDPDVLAGWGCYVDRVAQRCGVHIRYACPIRDPLGEASWYDGEAREALRVLLDAHAVAYLHLHRTQGLGGHPVAVGSIVSWAHWVPAGLRGRVEVELRERLGPSAWLGVLATGKLAPPFSLVGELSNGTPALDWIGLDWQGEVELPGERLVGPAPAALPAVLGRLQPFGKPVCLFGADASSVRTAGLRPLDPGLPAKRETPAPE